MIVGNRGNIYVHNGHKPGVYLYTHWTGSELPAIVQDGLKRFPGRWTDDQYLARILFDALTDGRHGEETGYGISADQQDGGSQMINVNTESQAVSFYGFDYPTMSIKEFVNYSLVKNDEDDESDD